MAKRQMIDLRHIKSDQKVEENPLFNEEEDDTAMVNLCEKAENMSLDDLIKTEGRVLLKKDEGDIVGKSLNEIIKIREGNKDPTAKGKPGRDPRSSSLDEIIQEKRYKERDLRRRQDESIASVGPKGRPLVPILDVTEVFGGTENLKGFDVASTTCDSEFSMTSNLGGKATPIYLLKMIITSDIGVNVKLECFDLEIQQDVGPGMEKKDERNHRWRCQIFWGSDVMGIGEAPRKILARHVAAWNLIEKLREIHNDVDIPPCSIPLGCYISPFVYAKLRMFCQANNIQPPIFRSKIHRVKKGGAYYSVICYVSDGAENNLKFTGNDQSETFGRRIAAKLALDYLSGKSFPLDEIFEDEEMCFEEENFDCTETAVTNIIFLEEFADGLVEDGEGSKANGGGARSARGLNGEGEGGEASDPEGTQAEGSETESANQGSDPGMAENGEVEMALYSADTLEFDE